MFQTTNHNFKEVNQYATHRTKWAIFHNYVRLLEDILNIGISCNIRRFQFVETCSVGIPPESPQSEKYRAMCRGQNMEWMRYGHPLSWPLVMRWRPSITYYILRWDIYYLNETRIVLAIITEIVNIHDWIMIAALRIGRTQNNFWITKNATRVGDFLSIASIAATRKSLMAPSPRIPCGNKQWWQSAINHH